MKYEPLIDKAKLPNLRNAVIGIAQRRGMSLRSLSLRMGHHENYLSDNLASKQPRISFLLELSAMLHTNLLESYLHLLPPTVRPTAIERDQLDQLDRMRQERDTARAERDKYWALLEKRGS